MGRKGKRKEPSGQVRAERPYERVERLDDDALAHRAGAGDDAAFATIYQRYFDPVYAYVRMAIRDPHDAEDVTQQAFAKAFAAVDRYKRRPKTPFRAWLYRIARNEAVSHIRRQARLERWEPSAIDERREADAPVEAAAAPPRSPESFDWITDVDLTIWVERLPVPQRQALTLRYLLDLSSDEIGRVLDRTPEDVRQLEHRALRFLEQRLGQLRQGSREKRRNPMVREGRPMTVLRSRRFGLQTGAANRPWMR